MLNETFYLDGIDAKSAGIYLQAPIEFSEAVPVVEAQTIPGRNGDLIWETGSYENRSGSASCFCLQEDVGKAISSAGRFLMGKKGYRRLETSDDPDHYWMARVENSPQIAMRLRTLAPFEIGFDCKPQRFVKDGEQAIVINSDSDLYNDYGQVALPIIKVYGVGSSAILEIGNTRVGFSEETDFVILDSETQNAYTQFNQNWNNKIDAPSFPVLTAGNNTIFLYNIEKVEIIPRWWEL